MALKKRPNQSQIDIKAISPEAFIAANENNEKSETEKVQIALRLPKELLKKIDEEAEQRYTSRNAVINFLCAKGLSEKSHN